MIIMADLSLNVYKGVFLQIYFKQKNNKVQIIITFNTNFQINKILQIRIKKKINLHLQNKSYIKIIIR